MNRTVIKRTTCALVLLAGAPGAARAQSDGQPAARLTAAVPPPRATIYRGATALGLALRRLGPTQRVLMIGAHPDDEDTQLLATLALGGGADVAYLSLTRGEGGQDAIGPDFQEALGIIRTEELLAARQVDGAMQFFGREYDYGFSKSAAEAFEHWPRDSVLKDVVRVIRRFRPDVVVSVWTGTPRDGHGQHQASGIVAKEAFVAAADSTRFPELQAEGMRPWAARKLYEGGYSRQDSLTTRYATGNYDPLLGLSYAQVATLSRGRHRSQEMARGLPFGARGTGVNLVQDRAGAPAKLPERSMFQGLDTTLSGRAERLLGPSAAATRLLVAYDSVIRSTRSSFDPLVAGSLVPSLARAVRLLLSADSALDRAPTGGALTPYLDVERRDAENALADAAGIVFDASASVEQVAPGDSLELVRTVWNGGQRPVRWQVSPDSQVTLAPGATATAAQRLVLPPDTPPSEPYYLRLPRHGDLYTWPAGDSADALPFGDGFALSARLQVEGAPVQLTREATFRAVNPVEGEIRRPVRIVPAVSLTLDRYVAVRPLAARSPLPVDVRLVAQRRQAAEGELRLQVPAGWQATPAAVPLRLAGHEARTIHFAVTPQTGAPAGRNELAATFRDASGQEFARGFRLIDYPHIQPHPLYADSRLRVELLAVSVPAALRARPIGYITGAGDEVPGALSQLGLTFQSLTPELLPTADLSRFSTIVVGVRAYEVRPDLAVANRRLLDWVKAGGSLVLQYQQAGWADGGYAPYPLTFARPADRVTDETAAVTPLDNTSPILNKPNQITAVDWQGWVQERGLWFPRSWDAAWKPVVQMADPGEAPQRGAILVARYGKGTVVYTGLSLFRQLPAGVPGAYRLFVNILGLGQGR